MRLVTKAAIVLFVLYVAFVGGIAYWMERSVRSVSRSVLRNTARLIGNDIAAVISKSAIDELRLGDPEARTRLNETIEDITARSEVVSSVSVVDSTGKVVASDELEIGRQVAVPDLIFSGDGHSDYGEPGLIRQDDAYYLFVPLLHQQKMVGYLRLALNSEPFTVVYSRARRDFAVVSLTGLGGIAILLILLHATMRRRTSRLLDTLDQATGNRPGDEGLPVDEFSPVEEAVRRLGAQLAATVHRAAQAEQCFDAAHAITNAALMVLNGDKTLRFANQRARDLMGYPAAAELESRWNEVQALIEDAWESVAMDGNLARLHIELVDTKPPRSVELRAVELGEGERAGFAMLVIDKTLGAAVDHDLSSALQLDVLQATSSDAVVAVRAMAETVDANLQSLRASLEQDEGQSIDDRVEQQTEYIDTIEDTVASLDALCRSLLAQINQRKTPYSPFDLRDLLSDLLQLLSPAALRKQIVIEPHQIAAPLLLSPLYRPLRDVLLNILLHILDWMPEGTTVCPEVDRTPTQLSITWRCSAASTLSPRSWQLFEPHILDDQGAARIGLGVARTVVDGLGGLLDVYTSPAGGTSYRVTVPLASKATPVVPPGSLASQAT